MKKKISLLNSDGLALGLPEKQNGRAQSCTCQVVGVLHKWQIPCHLQNAPCTQNGPPDLKQGILIYYSNGAAVRQMATEGACRAEGAEAQKPAL